MFKLLNEQSKTVFEFKTRDLLTKPDVHEVEVEEEVL